MSHATQLHDRGSLADSMQIMNASVLPGNVYDEVYGQVHTRVVSTVQWTLEQALDAEVTRYLGVSALSAAWRLGAPTQPAAEPLSAHYGPHMGVALICVCPSCDEGTVVSIGRASSGTSAAGAPVWINSFCTTRWATACATCKKRCP